MIVELSQLRRLRKTLDGQKIVFLGGSFDLFHRGHLEYLKHSRQFGDVLVVAISTDKRIKQKKGPARPIIPQKDRLALIDAIRYVDYSLLAPEQQKNKPVPTMIIIAALKPDVFVTGDKKWCKYCKEVEDLGVKLKIIPRNRAESTTRIISRIIEGNSLIK